MSFLELERSLDYRFSNSNLLELALTHRSNGSPHNERLEFLGDSVLNFAITIFLFEKYSDIDEGGLSRLRASLVQQNSLATIASDLNLSKYLKLGEGELKSGGCNRPSILADCLEAVFGAIFKDSSFNEAQIVIEKQFVKLLNNLDLKTMCKDAKSLLQELLQSRKISLPRYLIVNINGAAHNQRFEIECVISELNIKTKSVGDTRRSAEQSAAKMAIDILTSSNSNYLDGNLYKYKSIKV